MGNQLFLHRSEHVARADSAIVDRAISGPSRDATLPLEPKQLKEVIRHTPRLVLHGRLETDDNEAGRSSIQEH